MAYEITVNIAPSGNLLSDGGRSLTGHMWFPLKDGDGNVASYGFAHAKNGDAWGAGKVYDNDDAHYIDPPYTYKKEISEKQFYEMQEFAENAKKEAEAKNGRWAEYAGLWNSCVDFTWSALNSAGLADTPEAGWQGNILPWFNRWSIENEFVKRANLDAPGDGTANNRRTVRDAFINAQNWRPPRYDPLTLDLDGDGLETVEASAIKPILFDHDGDGIRNGSSWVKPNDGFLAMDRNGNGTIDNGSELFGDATALYAGAKAVDGFAALAQEDSNLDGKVDSADARWRRFRVWRDLNQDGLSQQHH